MIIISKDKDYYDYASTYGVDPTVRWERYQEMIDVIMPDFKPFILGDYWGRHWIRIPNKNRRIGFGSYVETWYLGICGELIPVIKVSTPVKDTSSVNQIWLTEHVFTQSVDECIERLKPEAKHISKYLPEKLNSFLETGRTDMYPFKLIHAPLFLMPSCGAAMNMNATRNNQFEYKEIIRNVNLKDRGLQHFVPDSPEILFDRISSFIATSKEEPATTSRTEEQWVESKGMTDKSFRRRQPKKRKRKK